LRPASRTMPRPAAPQSPGPRSRRGIRRKCAWVAGHRLLPAPARSWVCLSGQPRKYRRHDFTREGQSFVSFLKCGQRFIAWVTKLPGVVAERRRPNHKRLQRGVDSAAQLPDCLDVMRFTERLIMPGEITLECLLSGLLAMKDHIVQ